MPATARRRRLWSTTVGSRTVSNAGQGGQASHDLGENVQQGLGIAHLAGFTLSRTHVRILMMSDVDNTAVSVLTSFFGIGIYAGSIDNGDFPDLSLYDGDWMAYGSMVTKMPGALSTLVLPESRAVYEADFRSMRRIDRIGEVPFLVLQHNSTDDIQYHYTVSQLILLP